MQRGELQAPALAALNTIVTER